MSKGCHLTVFRLRLLPIPGGLVLLLFSLILQAGYPLQAQPRYKFRSYTQQDGLPNNTVMHIVQDQFGFIWLGTANGLSRFDGQEFLQFRYDPEAPHSISSNYINALYFDQRTYLWISTTTGLNRLNTATGQLDRIPLDFPRPNDSPLSIGAVLEDRHGNIWAGVQDYGLVTLAPAKDRDSFHLKLWATSSRDTATIADSYVAALLEDASGKIWACFRNAVDRIDLQSGEIRHFRHQALGSDPGKNRIRHAVMTHNGTLVMTFLNTGIFQINTGETDPQIRSCFSTELLSSLPEGISYNKLMIDQSRQLWVATTTHGVVLVDSARTSYQLLASQPDGSGALSSADIRSVFEGKTGNIWIGTGNAGLNRGKRLPDQYRLLRQAPDDPSGPSPGQIFAIAGSPDDFLWLGHLGSGIDQFRINEEQQLIKLRNFRYQSGNTDGLTSNDIIRLLTDRHGHLWIGTNGQGLNELDPRTGKIRAFLHDPADTTTISGNRIWAICEDKEGYIWVGGYRHGLSRLDPKTGAVRRFHHQADNVNSLSSDHINTLLTDSKGHIWVGTDSGLDCYDPVTGNFSHYIHQSDDPTSLSNNLIYCLYEDPSGRIWVGTNLGLNKLTPVDAAATTTGYLIERYFEKHGLPGNTIFNLQNDSDGNIWVGTDNGLARMLTQQSQPSFALLNNEDGMENAAVLFNAHYLHEKSGWLFFANNAGLLAFHPDYLRQKGDDYGSGLLLNAVTRFQRTGPELKIISDPFVCGKTSLHLGPADQVVTFDLSDLNWTKDRRYEYRLIGFHEQWIPLSDKLEVTFTNLAPGEYKLLLRGRSWDDCPTAEVSFLNITVTPPWWKSRWAFGWYALIFIAAALLIRRLAQRRRHRKQQAEIDRARAEEKLKQAQQIEIQAAELEQSLTELQQKNNQILIAQNQLIQQEKLASLGQLTAGIAHEIKNPLNFINNFAEGSIELLDELLGELGLETKAHPPSERSGLLQQIINELVQNAHDIKDNGLRVDRIIRSMMDHARGTGNERRLTDLNQLIDDNINLAYHGYRALDPGFSCLIEKDLDPEIKLVNVFPQAIGRVLLNLLNNACYAVGERQKHRTGAYQGRIRVSTSLLKTPGANPSSRIGIRIRDNGAGIPDSIREKIFEPFYTSKPTGAGNAGLGLSISYDIIVKQHQGQLLVESQVGEFTEFTILLDQL